MGHHDGSTWVNENKQKTNKQKQKTDKQKQNKNIPTKILLECSIFWQ